MTARRRLLLAFLLTRAALLALTAAPLNIAASRGDIQLYSMWANQILGGAMPYSAVPIEYPPGVLPFVLAADVLAAGIHYRTGFTIVMLVLDIAGMVGLWRMARVRGSWTGPWIWVLAVFLLGPIVYLRLDLIPAVATIWAIERMHRGAAATSGGLVAFGAVAKLYPALLAPASALRTVRPLRFLVAASAVTIVALLPFIATLPDLAESVLGFHGDRGIQLESSWGTALMIAMRSGYDVTLELSFRAFHFRADIVPTLEAIATVLSIAVVVGGTWLLARHVDRGDTGRLSAGLYGILALVMVTGTVLSPQFVVWLIALSAAALCFPMPELRSPLQLIVVIAALTQLVFPLNFNALKDGEVIPLVMLVARNVLLLGSGAATLLALARTFTNASSTEGPSGPS